MKLCPFRAATLAGQKAIATQIMKPMMPSPNHMMPPDVSVRNSHTRHADDLSRLSRLHVSMRRHDALIEHAAASSPRDDLRRCGRSGSSLVGSHTELRDVI